MKVIYSEGDPDDENWDGIDYIFVIAPENKEEAKDFFFEVQVGETFGSPPGNREVNLEKLKKGECEPPALYTVGHTLDSIAFEGSRGFDNVTLHFGNFGHIHLEGKLLEEFVKSINEAYQKLDDGIKHKKNRIEMKISRRKGDIEWAINELKKELINIDRGGKKRTNPNFSAP